MSTRQRGRTLEIRCNKELMSQGWITCLTDMPHKWKKQQDFWGVFDIIGLRKKIRSRPEKIYVQVKSGSTQGCLKILKAFKEDYLADDDIVQIWVWEKRKVGRKAGWRVVNV